ncbi:hypothetical protein BH10ACT1_BH10ACT1_13180 [soil metagenome]
MAAELALGARAGTESLPFVAAHIQLGDVAAELGRSRTSLYKLWASQDLFQADLARFLILDHDYRTPAAELPWNEIVLPALTSPPGLTDVFETARCILNEAQVAVLEDPWIRVRAVMIGYGDAGALADVRQQVEERRQHDLADTLSGTFRLFGLRIAPPTDSHSLAVALWCLGDGFAILSRKLPRLSTATVDIDDGLGPRPWHLFSFMVRRLLEGALVGQEPSGGTEIDGPHTAGAATPITAWTEPQRRVLAVGARLFVERLAPSDELGCTTSVTGLASVTIAAVARRAKVSRRSVYDVWQSSEALRLDVLRALVRAEQSYVSGRLDKVIASVPHTSRSASTAAITAVLRRPHLDRIDPGDAANTFLLDLANPDVAEIFAEGTERTLGATIRRIERLWPSNPHDTGFQAAAEVRAVALLSLARGSSRLLRTNPGALVVDRDGRLPQSLVLAARTLLDPTEDRATQA